MMNKVLSSRTFLMILLFGLGYLIAWLTLNPGTRQSSDDPHSQKESPTGHTSSRSTSPRSRGTSQSEIRRLELAEHWENADMDLIIGKMDSIKTFESNTYDTGLSQELCDYLAISRSENAVIDQAIRSTVDQLKQLQISAIEVTQVDDTTSKFVIIVLLIGAAIVFLIIRKNGPETARETTPAGNEKDQNQSSALLPDASADSPTSNAHSEPQVSKAFPKLVAIEGKGIVLKVFNDGNFQLSLSASAGDILVPVGEDFFQTSVADIPTGVRIKVRNGNGEILTTTDVSGLDGWYTPAVYSSNSYAVLPNQERELLRTDQRSAVFKLSGMILILPRNLKNQDDLEFKLSVHSYLHSSAREANGDPLNPETFPEFETDWLDGSLLFVGE